MTTMVERDPAATSLGIELVEAAPGRAEVRMRVRPDMLNGHGTCHGGVVFTLADTAFAVACNTDRDVTVAAGATIEFLAPARDGAILTARCAERARQGRSGYYEVDVVADDGAIIALFQGRSRTIGAPPAR